MATKPNISFDASATKVVEGGLAKRISLTADISQGSDYWLYFTVSGTAVEADYISAGLVDLATPVAGQKRAIVRAGFTTPHFTLGGLLDALTESDETMVATLNSDPAHDYTVDTSNDTHTVTIVSRPNEGRLNVEGIALNDGTATDFNQTNPRMFFTTIPMNPPSATIPDYYFYTAEDPTTLVDAQVIGLDRNSDGEWLSLQLISTMPKTNLRQSIPGDNDNPCITIKKGTSGTTYSGATFKTFDLANCNLEIKLANVTTPYIFEPGDATGEGGVMFANEVDYTGPYSRRTVQKGRFVNPNVLKANRVDSDSCLVVKFVVEERTDVDAARVDIVIENSALNPRANPYGVNFDADGTVHFEWIKVHTGNTTHAWASNSVRDSYGVVASTSNRSFWLVKPCPDILNQGESGGSPISRANDEHGMLPGDSFVRHLVSYKTSVAEVDLVIATQIAKRYDHGYVCGALGFESGGWMDAGYHLPAFEDTAVTYSSETNMRAWNKLGIDLEDDLVTHQTTQAIKSVGNAARNFGWARPSGVGYGGAGSEAQINPVGARSFGFRAANTALLESSAMLERHRMATFNTITGRNITDAEIVAAGKLHGKSTEDRLPFGSLVSNLNIYSLLPWNTVSPVKAGVATDDVTSGSITFVDGGVTYESWALAPTSFAWNTNNTGKTTWYLSETTGPNDSFNWQFNNKGYWGPHQGTHSSRTHFGFRFAAYALNDYTAKLGIAQEGEAKLMSMARYKNKGGSQADIRHHYSQSESNLKHMTDTENNLPAGISPTSNGGLNQGYHWNESGYRMESGTPRQTTHPAVSISMLYAFAGDSDRARITDDGTTTVNGSTESTGTHSFPELLSDYVGRLVTPTGCYSIVHRPEGSPPFTGVATTVVSWPDITTTRGKVPGLWKATNTHPEMTNNRGNNPPKWYGCSHGIHVTYQVQLAMAVNRIFPTTGSLFDPWPTILGWAKYWSNGSDGKVEPDEAWGVTGGTPTLAGSWHYSASWIASVGTDGHENEALTVAAMENGDAHWVGMTQLQDPDASFFQREPERFSYTAAAYAQSNGNDFGDAAKGISRNYSLNALAAPHADASDATTLSKVIEVLDDVAADLEANDRIAYLYPTLGLMSWSGFGL